MADSFNPWIKEYLNNISLKFGANLTKAKGVKDKKVQVVKFLNTHSRLNENAVLWATVSDKKYLMPVKFTEAAVTSYLKKNPNETEFPDFSTALVTLKTASLVFTRIPKDKAVGITDESHLAFECSAFTISTKYRGEKTWRTPVDILKDEKIKSYVEGLRAGGGGGNVHIDKASQAQLGKMRKMFDDIPSPRNVSIDETRHPPRASGSGSKSDRQETRRWKNWNTGWSIQLQLAQVTPSLSSDDDDEPPTPEGLKIPVPNDAVSQQSGASQYKNDIFDPAKAAAKGDESDTSQPIEWPSSPPPRKRVRRSVSVLSASERDEDEEDDDDDEVIPIRAVEDDDEGTEKVADEEEEVVRILSSPIRPAIAPPGGTPSTVIKSSPTHTVRLSTPREQHSSPPAKPSSTASPPGRPPAPSPPRRKLSRRVPEPEVKVLNASYLDHTPQVLVPNSDTSGLASQSQQSRSHQSQSQHSQASWPPRPSQLSQLHFSQLPQSTQQGVRRSRSPERSSQAEQQSSQRVKQDVQSQQASQSSRAEAGTGSSQRRSRSPIRSSQAQQQSSQRVKQEVQSQQASQSSRAPAGTGSSQRRSRSPARSSQVQHQSPQRAKLPSQEVHSQQASQSSRSQPVAGSSQRRSQVAPSLVQPTNSQSTRQSQRSPKREESVSPVFPPQRASQSSRRVSKHDSLFSQVSADASFSQKSLSGSQTTGGARVVKQASQSQVVLVDDEDEDEEDEDEDEDEVDDEDADYESDSEYDGLFSDDEGDVASPPSPSGDPPFDASDAEGDSLAVNLPDTQRDMEVDQDSGDASVVELDANNAAPDGQDENEDAEDETSDVEMVTVEEPEPAGDVEMEDATDEADEFPRGGNVIVSASKPKSPSSNAIEMEADDLFGGPPSETDKTKATYTLPPPRRPRTTIVHDDADQSQSERELVEHDHGAWQKPSFMRGGVPGPAQSHNRDGTSETRRENSGASTLCARKTSVIAREDAVGADNQMDGGSKEARKSRSEGDSSKSTLRPSGKVELLPPRATGRMNGNGTVQRARLDRARIVDWRALHAATVTFLRQGREE